MPGSRWGTKAKSRPQSARVHPSFPPLSLLSPSAGPCDAGTHLEGEEPAVRPPFPEPDGRQSSQKQQQLAGKLCAQGRRSEPRAREGSCRRSRRRSNPSMEGPQRPGNSVRWSTEVAKLWLRNLTAAPHGQGDLRGQLPHPSPEQLQEPLLCFESSPARPGHLSRTPVPRVPPPLTSAHSCLMALARLFPCPRESPPSHLSPLPALPPPPRPAHAAASQYHPPCHPIRNPQVLPGTPVPSPIPILRFYGFFFFLPKRIFSSHILSTLLILTASCGLC